jgi:hypothetical protein
MIRSVGTALVGTAVLAALAGCAYQDPFALPGLTPRGSSPGVQVQPGYGYSAPGYGYNGGYGYGYGYPNGYQPGYGFTDPYYTAQGSYPYGYYRPYNSYPQYIVVPCPDNNRDGRCDSKPPKDHDHHGNGHGNGHGSDNGNDHDGGNPDRDDTPARPRDGRNVAPAIQPRTTPVPAPVPQQPARVHPEPRRATPEGVTPRGPRGGRVPATGDDTSPVRPTQEP